MSRTAPADNKDYIHDKMIETPGIIEEEERVINHFSVYGAVVLTGG